MKQMMFSKVVRALKVGQWQAESNARANERLAQIIGDGTYHKAAAEATRSATIFRETLQWSTPPPTKENPYVAGTE
jgi:hypothetical protein